MDGERSVNAPDIHPRPDVYKLLQRESRTQSRFFSSQKLRWLAVASAGAFLVILDRARSRHFSSILFRYVHSNCGYSGSWASERTNQ